jgi:hexosaminidase
VLNSADFLFFDHAYEADPKERGLSWATRASDAREVFSYVSGNIAANLQLLPECEVLPCAERLAGAAAITRTENVLGIESELWSETVRSDEQLE